MEGFMKRFTGLLVVTWLAGALGASAAPIVDQSYTPPFDYVVGVDDTFHAAQTFTAGLTGDLVGFDFYLWNPDSVSGDLTYEVSGTTAGAPSGPALASGSVPVPIPATPLNPFFLNVPLATPVPVTAGQVLALILNVAPVGVFWVGDLRNGYAPGNHYFAFAPAFDWTLSQQPDVHDLGFRTYVDAQVTAVPEPASLLLVGTGCALAWRSRRRR
jgi:hypothetical protein